MLVKRKAWLAILDNIKKVLARLQNAAELLMQMVVQHNYLNGRLRKISSWLGQEVNINHFPKK